MNTLYYGDDLKMLRDYIKDESTKGRRRRHKGDRPSSRALPPSLDGLNVLV